MGIVEDRNGRSSLPSEAVSEPNIFFLQKRPGEATTQSAKAAVVVQPNEIPAMKSTEHPSRALLIAYGKNFPGIFQILDEGRGRQRAAGEPLNSIFTSTYGATNAVHNYRSRNDLKQLSVEDTVENGIVLNTLGAWRLGQTVVRFDATLYNTLISSELSGEIPVQILTYLPAWALYIETPGLEMPLLEGGAQLVLGIFVCVERNSDGIPTQLTVLPHFGMADELSLRLARLPLEAGKSVLDLQNLAIERSHTKSNACAEAALQTWTAIFNMLLYICTQQAAEPACPQDPTPSKTKKGERIFPATAVQYWDIGVRIGAALRRSYSASGHETSGFHGAPRPHLRRAHWHGYRTGPKKLADGTEIPTAKRQFELKWLPPIPVNVDDLDAMPTTIRSVSHKII